MFKDIKDIVIIGAGPSGVMLFNRFKNCKSIALSFIDKYKTPFHELKKMGVFYENFNAETPLEYQFLVDGTKTGKDIANYITTLVGDLKINKFDVVSIEKAQDFFVLSDRKGNNMLTRKVVLATGLRSKKLPIVFRKKCDISQLKISSYFNDLDVLNKELVFIGSGDSVAFKALKACKFFSKTNQHTSKNVRIFAKINFYKRINPIFAKELRVFERIGVLDLKLGNFEIKKVSYNKKGNISSLDFGNLVYKPKSKNGAVVCVCIGFEPNLPQLVNCDISDIHIVGDLHSWYNKHTISVYNAINSVNLVFEQITLK